MRSTNLILLAGLAQLGASVYVLEDDYQPDTFLDKFEFFSDTDPTYSYVTYLDRSQAEKEGLVDVKDNTVYLGVDHKNVASGNGRKSVRIETKKTYDKGLIIADIEHMPGGACGTWPAFWTTGPSWPKHGELDIIEGVNMQEQNLLALHTKKGCSIDTTGNFTGTVKTANCDVFAPDQANNQGCLFEGPKSSTYGPEFNRHKGGVYATEWTNDGITIWFFPRDSVPQNIEDGKPDTSSWGKPVSEFVGDFEIDDYVQKQRIVFNTAFCGDWAEGEWDGSPCSAKGSCKDYVKNNPEAFKETYWSINYMQVYQERAQAPSSPPADSSPPRTTKAAAPTGGNPSEPESAKCTPKPTSCTTYTTLTTVPITKTAAA